MEPHQTCHAVCPVAPPTARDGYISKCLGPVRNITSVMFSDAEQVVGDSRQVYLGALLFV